MKKFLCALLALVLALACVPAMADVARVTDETKEFTLWAAYNPTYQTEWESMKAWQYFEEATGVHINWVLFSNDEMGEKLNTLIGSADLEHFPDGFYRCWISDSTLKRFGPDGMFVDLKDLVKDNAPNLCKALDEMDAWSNVLDPVTGAMYSVPELNSALSARMHPKLFFNKKMLEAVGGELPTTTDELYDLLVKVKNADANGNGDTSDEIGITSNGLSNVLRAFTGAFGINNRGREDLSVDADPSDPSKIRFVYTSDAYREYLTYIARLYQEGLIDPELFELSTAKMVAKGSQDMIFGLSYTNCQAASVDANDYVGLEVALKGPNGDQQWNNMIKGVGLGAFAVSPTCEDPATLVKWIDSFYSEDGALMFYFGKDGEDFYYDEDGMPAYNKELLDQVSSENPYDKVISAITPFASGTLPVLIKDAFFCGAECRGVNLQTAENLAPYVNEVTWKFNFTTDESEELSPLSADLLTNCHDVYRAKFIKGELDISDDSVWQSYVDEMQSLGLDRYIEIYQGALDRMQAQN